MNQKLNTGDSVRSLTKQSDNNWVFMKEDNTTILFDYGVWNNSEKKEMTLYNRGYGIATVDLESITEESRQFVDENIII